MTWHESDIEVNGIRMHYARTGGDKPPLILLHGAGDAGLCWTPIARELERDYDIVMPDARGHGHSASPESGYSTLERAADVAGLIEALGLDRPVVMGHSMGAMTALALAARYPQLVSRVIMEDPVFRIESRKPPSEEERRQWIDYSRHHLAETKSLGREGIIARARDENPAWPEDELGPWADARLNGDGGYIGKVQFPETPGWQTLLSEVTIPALLITADTDRGAITPPEAAAEAQRIDPSLQVVHIPGAGHNIRREQRQRFLDAVTQFLHAPQRAPA